MLDSTEAVVHALGGWGAVAELTGKRYGTAWQWKRNGFPADTYLVLQAALRERGLEAPPSLWGMVEPPVQAAS